MVILLSDRFAEPWNGKCSCLLDYLQTLLVFAAVLIHAVAGLWAENKRNSNAMQSRKASKNQSAELQIRYCIEPSHTG